MTEFKAGDRVLIKATVREGPDPDDDYYVAADSGHRFYVSTADLEPAPEPPYQEPDLRPGMVVMSEDETDGRSWWTQEGSAVGLWFVPVSMHDANRRRRHELPDRIRVVWPT